MTDSQRIIPDGLLCPSAPAAEGAVVIGVVASDGSVGYIRDRITATSAFLEVARAEGEPEQRFRFGSPCQQCACAQWAGGQCSLPDRLAAVVPTSTEASQRLPRCSIRPQCRWFRQSGAEACRLCPLVVTRGGTPHQDFDKNREET